MAGPAATVQAHKKGSKVQSLSANPADPALLLSAGNDHAVRLLDLRSLSGGADEGVPGDRGSRAPSQPPAWELATLAHPKVPNSAYFSPLTGRKILTTGQDNRLRVWDYVLSPDQAPSREIVHSQNFNRYLSPFRAEWDPKDPTERAVVCGRYISEDFGGVALHPVDLLDAATGRLAAELVDPNVATISPVNKIHPRLDLVVSGSSRSLFVWRPDDDEAAGAGLGALQGEDAREGLQRRVRDLRALEADDSGDDDDDVDAIKKRKKARAVPRPPRTAALDDEGADQKKAAAARKKRRGSDD